MKYYSFHLLLLVFYWFCLFFSTAMLPTWGTGILHTSGHERPLVSEQVTVEFDLFFRHSLTSTYEQRTNLKCKNIVEYN